MADDDGIVLASATARTDPHAGWRLLSVLASSFVRLSGMTECLRDCSQRVRIHGHAP